MSASEGFRGTLNPGASSVSRTAAWKKSCHANNTCLYVLPARPGEGALVGDEQGEILPVSAGAWRALLARVRGQ